MREPLKLSNTVWRVLSAKGYPPPHSWTLRQLDLRKFSSGRAENGAFALNKVKKVPNRALIGPKQAKDYLYGLRPGFK